MRGTLTINGRIYRNVYLENVEETDSIIFHQLNEDGNPVETTCLRKVKYLISGEELEITGFKTQDDRRQKRDHNPRKGETLICIHAKFKPDSYGKYNDGSMETREQEENSYLLSKP